jgi:integrase
MPERPRTYRKKALAVFEAGTRIYAPPRGERRYRVVATDVDGRRLYAKFSSEEAARAKARDLEKMLLAATPVRDPNGPRTVATLAAAYLEHLQARSTRYRERQETIIGTWVLHHLGPLTLGQWSPAECERVLNAARRAGRATATVQNIGSAMRSLVTFAHKSRWLARDVDPMWHVAYSAKADHQGQAVGFIPRATLPNDTQCADLFAAFGHLGEPAWGLGMRLAHRSGLRWGELIALRPTDIDLAPHRVVRVHRAVEQDKTGVRRFKSTKNAQARTTIYPASLAPLLEAHIDRVRAEWGEDGLLFADPDGQPPEHRQFLRLWHRAARTAGWPMRTRRDAISHPHDLRHAAACWMLFDLGIDPALAARMLGHANAAFTLSRYVGVRTGSDHALTTHRHVVVAALPRSSCPRGS